MKQLKLAPNLTLPAQAVTETFAVIAARGAGKSNTGAVMAEEMFAAGLPFVAIDPVGSWYGLRSSADGKGPGLPIPIFGGRRGDVPLERGGGPLVADLIVEQRLSCVLDLTGFDSEAAKIAFLTGFARRLYQKNEAPLHLFLEEADDYIPQKPMREEAQLLRAWENIVRRGRARGLGMTMITQRSAVINKNVLTQAQTLIAMRTVGPQDVEAVEKWLKFHGQSREILSTLAELADGEAWVWSPNFLRETVRVRFRRRSTFDSGATPKVSKAARPPATLADIDVTKIAGAMQETIERAKQEDPAHLRRRIAELERVAKAGNIQQTPSAEGQISTAEVRELRRRLQVLERDNASLAAYADELEAAIAVMEETRDSLRAGLQEWTKLLGMQLQMPKRPKAAPGGIVNREAVAAAAGYPVDEQRRRDLTARGNGAASSELGRGERLVLTAIAQHPDGVDAAQLGVLTGYRKTSRDTYIKRLRAYGFVAPGWPARVTDAGLAALGDDFEPLPTGAALREYWLARLSEGERKVLEVVLAAWPAGVLRTDIDDATMYKKTSRDTYLKRLRARKLVENVADRIRASEALF